MASAARLRPPQRWRCFAFDQQVPPLDVAGTHTAVPQGDLVHCVSPLLSPNRTLSGVLPPLSPHPLYVSLNAQQYTALLEEEGHERFTFITPPPRPSIVRPLAGAPGTPVTIFGAGYAGGCDYRCRFGVLGTVAASYEAGRAALRCAAPDPAARGAPALNGSAALELAVSLNGQQFDGIATNFSLEAL